MLSFQSTSKQKIDRGFSLWLDFVRFACAIAVVEFHATNQHIAGFTPVHWPLGLDAVMVFFVLSGFVIAFVADTKETTFADYAVSRLARLWSVLIPALALTFIADKIGMALSPSLYENWGFTISPQSSAWHLVPSAFFLNQIWFYPIVPLSNGPVWSIGFEFWYYAIFACIVYFEGLRRVGLVCLAAAFVGPRILLLSPAWFLGAGCYHLLKRWKPAKPLAGWLFFVLPLCPLVLEFSEGKLALFVSATGAWIGANPTVEMWEYCDRFVWWYIAGILIALHFIGASAVSLQIEAVLGSFSRVIRRAAGVTLSIYLFHLPLLLLYTAILKDWHPGYARTTVVSLSAILSSAALGSFIEPKRYALREWLKAMIARRSVVPLREPQ
jgi:peptidoglycan/LPS O-acetylase OafA/YrhL